MKYLPSLTRCEMALKSFLSLPAAAAAADGAFVSEVRKPVSTLTLHRHTVCTQLDTYARLKSAKFSLQALSRLAKTFLNL